MYQICLAFVLIAMVFLQVAHLASLVIPEYESMNLSELASDEQSKVIQIATTDSRILDEPPTLVPPALAYSQNSAQSADFTSSNVTNRDSNSNSTSSNGTTIETKATTTTTATTTVDPNSDPDDTPGSTPTNIPANGLNPSKLAPNEPSNINQLMGNITYGKPLSQDAGLNLQPRSSLEFNILLYSIFIVYVSFIKLIYHNVAIINYNLNEPGILMIFGIIWELVARQVSTNHDSFPRFNSRIFFYLFLPSTVLESASLLSNKWLFLNLFPIMVHSILGTLLYSSAMGFTIYSLGKQNIFNLNISIQSSPLYDNNPTNNSNSTLVYNITNDTWTQDLTRQTPFVGDLEGQLDLSDQLFPPNNIIYNSNLNKGYLVSNSALEISNLTLTDCLLFGTILSSIESNTMLGISKLFHVNERLYYLILGENLMNNAVVLVLFNLLLEFFNTTRLTVVKIYFATLQFFITLVGSIFIGLGLAGVALISVRLTKKFQVPNASTSQQNQYQAMVETLLILKLAYLAYTLASLAGTSRIVSLATFGILQDQYIKHNLNLRSQLTFRQVILATKTLGFSLVYPLLGMLLVEVSNSSQFFQYWMSTTSTMTTLSGNNGLVSSMDATSGQNNLKNNPTPNSRGSTSGAAAAGAGMLSAANLAASRLSQLANQANLYWNFKFLALAMLLVIVYRFIIVIVLSSLCNLFSSGPMRIKFKEQILVAYGGLKGPLAMALVQRLIEHEEYRDRTLRNKHLFMYTILFITFVSTVVFGSFVKPIVVKVQKSLEIQLCGSGNSHDPLQKSTVLFDQINQRVTEYISVGLNTILGRSKSPYDKFADWNESHIKPWLSGSETNTNWLSVFYDNLILDETLNANCFYRTTDARLAAAAKHLKSRFPIVDSRMGEGGSSSFVFRSIEETSKLDTIDENSLLAMQRHPNPKQDLKLDSSRHNFSIGLSTVDLHNSHHQHQHHHRRRRRRQLPNALHRNFQQPQRYSQKSAALVGKPEVDLKSAIKINNDVALKEFVMLNLKLEDSRSRNESAMATNRRNTKNPSAKVAPLNKLVHNDEIASSSRVDRSKQGQMVTRMLSTTSSDVGGFGGELSSAERRSRRDKYKHLAQVESLLDPKLLVVGSSTNFALKTARATNNVINNGADESRVANMNNVINPFSLSDLRRTTATRYGRSNEPERRRAEAETLPNLTHSTMGLLKLAHEDVENNERDNNDHYEEGGQFLHGIVGQGRSRVNQVNLNRRHH